MTPAANRLLQTCLLWGCFFMSGKSLAEIVRLRSLPRAILAWLIAAEILVPMAVFFVQWKRLGSDTLGYFSSAVSFAAAVCAGYSIREGRGQNGLLALLATGITLVVTLLLAGLLIGGGAMDPSSVLSVSCFTLAGCLFSGLLPAQTRKQRKKRSAYFWASKRRLP